MRFVTLAVLLLMGVVVCLLGMDVALAQEAVLTVPDHGVTVEFGDITGPGAILASAWKVSNELPKMAKAWSPNIHVDLTDLHVHVVRDEDLVPGAGAGD